MITRKSLSQTFWDFGDNISLQQFQVQIYGHIVYGRIVYGRIVYGYIVRITIMDAKIALVF